MINLFKKLLGLEIEDHNRNKMRMRRVVTDSQKGAPPLTSSSSKNNSQPLDGADTQSPDYIAKESTREKPFIEIAKPRTREEEDKIIESASRIRVPHILKEQARVILYRRSQEATLTDIVDEASDTTLFEKPFLKDESVIMREAFFAYQTYVAEKRPESAADAIFKFGLVYETGSQQAAASAEEYLTRLDPEKKHKITRKVKDPKPDLSGTFTRIVKDMFIRGRSVNEADIESRLGLAFQEQEEGLKLINSGDIVKGEAILSSAVKNYDMLIKMTEKKKGYNLREFALERLGEIASIYEQHNLANAQIKKDDSNLEKIIDGLPINPSSEDKAKARIEKEYAPIAEFEKFMTDPKSYLTAVAMIARQKLADATTYGKEAVQRFKEKRELARQPISFFSNTQQNKIDVDTQSPEYLATSLELEEFQRLGHESAKAGDYQAALEAFTEAVELSKSAQLKQHPSAITAEQEMDALISEYQITKKTKKERSLTVEQIANRIAKATKLEISGETAQAILLLEPLLSYELHPDRFKRNWGERARQDYEALTKSTQTTVEEKYVEPIALAPTTMETRQHSNRPLYAGIATVTVLALGGYLLSSSAQSSANNGASVPAAASPSPTAQSNPSPDTAATVVDYNQLKIPGFGPLNLSKTEFEKLLESRGVTAIGSLLDLPLTARTASPSPLRPTTDELNSAFNTLKQGTNLQGLKIPYAAAPFGNLTTPKPKTKSSQLPPVKKDLAKEELETVIEGDSRWSLAEEYFGHGELYPSLKITRNGKNVPANKSIHPGDKIERLELPEWAKADWPSEDYVFVKAYPGATISKIAKDVTGNATQWKNRTATFNKYGAIVNRDPKHVQLTDHIGVLDEYRDEKVDLDKVKGYDSKFDPASMKTFDPKKIIDEYTQLKALSGKDYTNEKVVMQEPSKKETKATAEYAQKPNSSNNQTSISSKTSDDLGSIVNSLNNKTRKRWDSDDAKRFGYESIVQDTIKATYGKGYSAADTSDLINMLLAKYDTGMNKDTVRRYASKMGVKKGSLKA